MYPSISLIQCCRYLCGNRCICTALILTVADALFYTNVSTTCFSLSLQILFSLPIIYNCIYILPFLRLEDTSFANFSSASHIFDNVRMLLIEIVHPLLALSMPCRYSSPKFCICNLRKSTIADAFPTKIISATLVWQSSALSFIKHTIMHKPKTNRIHFSEYDRGVGNT